MGPSEGQSTVGTGKAQTGDIIVRAPAGQVLGCSHNDMAIGGVFPCMEGVTA